jgi:hypothetical protein
LHPCLRTCLHMPACAPLCAVVGNIWP